MRKSALAGLFACAAIFVASSSSVSAESFDPLKTNNFEQKVLNANVIEKIEKQTQEETKKEPIVHTVGSMETLSSIAEKYDSTWSRLFNKNEQITDPNIIKIDDKITIPLTEEVLKDRPLPEPPVQEAVAATVQAPSAPSRKSAAASAPVRRGTVAGNTYSPGYCTWYAKNMRPDLPNNLGNANTWVSRAAAQGLATGSAPQAGAIGQQGMHVVYVQSVNADGTVTISEMNYKGLYVISTRTVPANTFRYIY